jgi:hypothetical protein
MTRALERRLTIVEQRLTPPRADPQVILIRGGLHGGDPMHATAGSRCWECAPGESFADFKARAVAAAMAAGERFVVVRGLPFDDERSSVMPICADRT